MDNLVKNLDLTTIFFVRAVAITYKNKQKPILTIKEALETNQPKQIGEPIKVGDIQGKPY
jgi:hypothetical protein